jgi:hypothetical protein
MNTPKKTKVHASQTSTEYDNIHKVSIVVGDFDSFTDTGLNWILHTNLDSVSKYRQFNSSAFRNILIILYLHAVLELHIPLNIYNIW